MGLWQPFTPSILIISKEERKLNCRKDRDRETERETERSYFILIRMSIGYWDDMGVSIFSAFYLLRKGIK